MAIQVTASKPTLPVISDDVAHEIQAAWNTLYTLMSSYGMPIEKPADQKAWERVFLRSINAVNAYNLDVKEREVRQFRAGVREAIAPHLETAASDKLAYDALPATLKARMGEFKSSITVPLSDIASVFEPGTTETDMVKHLKTMGYNIVKVGTGYGILYNLPKSIMTGDDNA